MIQPKARCARFPVVVGVVRLLRGLERAGGAASPSPLVAGAGCRGRPPRSRTRAARAADPARGVAARVHEPERARDDHPGVRRPARRAGGRDPVPPPAGHRRGGRRDMAQPQPVADELQLTRWLFLRLLGAVYAIAFVSLAVQVAGLIGPRGLTPAAAYLDQAHSIYGAGAYRALPTLFWMGAGDVALQAAAWTGAALGLLVVLGIAPRAALAGAWLLYLSLSVAGQDFLSFQWDALLLEAGLLAVLWAPPGWRPRRDLPAPSPLIRWLLVFLLFKLMFLSGA